MPRHENAQTNSPRRAPGRAGKTISNLEFDGVELAAIQGLNQKLQPKETGLTEFKQRIEKLEQLIASKNGGDQ